MDKKMETEMETALKLFGPACCMMHGFYFRSGQLVNGKLVRGLSFSNFRGMCCRYRFW